MRWGLLVVGVVVGGCSSKPISEASADGGASFAEGGSSFKEGGAPSAEGGQQAKAGEEAGGGAGPSAGASGTGGDRTDGSPACDTFFDEPSAQLPLLITNATARTIYLEAASACTKGQFFGVARPSGEPAGGGVTQCRQSCAEVRSHAIDFCEPLCGFDGGTVTLEPGQGISTVWDPRQQEWTSLPESCKRYEGGTLGCSVERALPDGSYVLSAKAGTATTNEFSHECEPFQNVCETEEADIGGDLLKAELSVALPFDFTNMLPLELVFRDP